MAKYSDVIALMRTLSTMYKEPTSAKDYMTIGYNKAVADAVVTVHRQPAADVVEVVRCKECKHKYYDGNQIICQKLYWCDGNNFEPSAEDFCSYGERGEDE